MWLLKVIGCTRSYLEGFIAFFFFISFHKFGLLCVCPLHEIQIKIYTNYRLYCNKIEKNHPQGGWILLQGTVHRSIYKVNYIQDWTLQRLSSTNHTHILLYESVWQAQQSQIKMFSHWLALTSHTNTHKWCCYLSEEKMVNLIHTDEAPVGPPPCLHVSLTDLSQRRGL